MTKYPTTMLNESISVLDHGFVRLDGVMADDLCVVNAARVSFAQHKEVMDLSDEGLIRFLMREKHTSPFEHNAFRFHVRAPIFVAREWFRHRIGAFNEFSLRYAKARDDFYVPAVEDVRSQIGKPGSYTFEPVDGDLADAARDAIQEVYDGAWQAYQTMLANNVARELARIVLPVGIYTEFYWTINAHTLMRFIALRGDSTALREIQAYARVVDDIFGKYMPVTRAQWGTFGQPLL